MQPTLQTMFRGILVNLKRYIAYYRVSTQRQGKSGLGVDAQPKAVNDRLSGLSNLIAEYTEVESGKPRLAEALAACRLHRATLIIAKLDRLARNVAFVSNLMDAGIEFEAVDFPQANRLTIHILSAVAEHEARMISDRTRVALSARRRQRMMRSHAASGQAAIATSKARLVA
jgi:DNA invertase Pin-like site-specific DNA recombinase